MILNMICGGGGGGGGDIDKSQIIVTVESGSTVTCTMGTDVRTASEENGTWRFIGLDNGTWTVAATKGENSTSTDVSIDKLTIVYVELAYRRVPEFTYTGDYALVNDDDAPLTDTKEDNWKIRLLTSGILTVTSFGAWDGALDAFLVGAGGGGGDSYGGGGGGGYAMTAAGISVSEGAKYQIIIGAGASGGKGGATSAFNHSAGGGNSGNGTYGGNGGSGGGSAAASNTHAAGGNGGTDGGRGGNGGYGSGGQGQGTSTREFFAIDGNTNATLYAGGGGGLWANGGAGGGGGSESNGTTNTGGGGGGSINSPRTAGGSGIVVIRNHR